MFVSKAFLCSDQTRIWFKFTNSKTDGKIALHAVGDRGSFDLFKQSRILVYVDIFLDFFDSWRNRTFVRAVLFIAGWTVENP